MFRRSCSCAPAAIIVINQTEALVAIDVNSGRATRERHIEDTALKTNLEAADEVARQLRLRDLAGLIVIDFIDMDVKRNNRSVERRLKECLAGSRSPPVGRISHSVPRNFAPADPPLLESSTAKCPYCGGSGHVRSVSSLPPQYGHFSVELSSTLARIRWRDISRRPKCEMRPTWMRARSCLRHSFSRRSTERLLRFSSISMKSMTISPARSRNLSWRAISSDASRLVLSAVSSM